MRDDKWKQERHERRMMLMRTEGDIIREEARLHRTTIIGVLLFALVLVGLGLL